MLAWGNVAAIILDLYLQQEMPDENTQAVTQQSWFSCRAVDATELLECTGCNKRTVLIWARQKLNGIERERRCCCRIFSWCCCCCPLPFPFLAHDIGEVCILALTVKSLWIKLQHSAGQWYCAEYLHSRHSLSWCSPKAKHLAVFHQPWSVGADGHTMDGFWEVKLLEVSRQRLTFL